MHRVPPNSLWMAVAFAGIAAQGCGSGDSTAAFLEDAAVDSTVGTHDGGRRDAASVGDSSSGMDGSATDGGAIESGGTDGGAPEAAAEGSPSDAPSEASRDATLDSGVDASAESGVDARADSGADASADSGADARADSGADASTDSGADSGGDAGTDGGTTPAYVLEHHNHPSRDGVYVDSRLTKAAIGTMHLDPGFSTTTSGATYAQPLFMSNGPQGMDTVFVVTENDDVFALDATSGVQLWMKNVGTSVGSGLPCGDVNPLGITGTPVIDLASRRIFFDAMIQGPGGAPRHNAFALSVDDGSIQWQTDLTVAIAGFDSTVQNQRSALTIVGGKVFIAFSGLDGDCGNYKGWVIGIPIANGQGASSWATAAYSGPGIWGPTGVASDGTSIYVATGNTNDRSPGHPRPTMWQNANSEAIIKLTTAPAFTYQSANYWAPTDWLQQDMNDADVGSSGVVLVDAPGATPSTLAFAMGKTATGHIVNRASLGGIGNGLSTIGGGGVFGSMFAYTTAQGTYVGAQTSFSGCSGGDFSVAKVSATNPPALSFGWCASQGGAAGPIVSETLGSGSGDNLVWGFGANGDGKLRAFDADTGVVLFTSIAVANQVQHWTSPIIAKGRVYMAADGTVYAFTL